MNISTEIQLRTLYEQPKERTLLKQLDHLDQHAKKFISLSPFLVLSTMSDSDNMDSSPRGGVPSFVQVLDDKTLLIPDSKGNNRLDSLVNIIETERVGILFLIPGMDETLRVNGRAFLSTAPDLIEQFRLEKKPIVSCIVVEVEEMFLHCAKALMRSKLWSEDYKIERSEMPSMGQMLKDQVGHNQHAETREEMLKRYQSDI
jgi:PPOX class probable FMN-dependent enzyme